MKIFLFLAVAGLPFGLQSLEHEMLCDNEQVKVTKVSLAAKEEVGLHRDEHPHIVIAIKGGTVRRLELDGTTNDVHFPTGKVVHRDADPVGKLHRGINISDETVELIVVELKGKK